MSALPQSIGSPRLPAWALWVAPVVVLALVVGWETDWGRQIVRVPSSPVPVEPKPVTVAALPDYQIEGGLAAHAETVQRTLFNATRRPAPTPTADDAPRQIAHGAFQLMGTTVTGDQNVAFLKELPNGKTMAVRQGDEIKGMKVAKVTADRVQFMAGDDTEDLILKVLPGPKTTLVAAPPPPGAPPSNVAAAAAARAAQARAQPAAVNPGQQVQPGQPAQNARAARRAARGAGQGFDGQSGSDMGGQSARAGRRR